MLAKSLHILFLIVGWWISRPAVDWEMPRDASLAIYFGSKYSVGVFLAGQKWICIECIRQHKPKSSKEERGKREREKERESETVRHFHFQMHMSYSALIVVISVCAIYLPFSRTDDDRDKRVELRFLSARVARCMKNVTGSQSNNCYTWTNIVRSG